MKRTLTYAIASLLSFGPLAGCAGSLDVLEQVTSYAQVACSLDAADGPTIVALVSASGEPVTALASDQATIARDCALVGAIPSTAPPASASRSVPIPDPLTTQP